LGFSDCHEGQTTLLETCDARLAWAEGWWQDRGRTGQNQAQGSGQADRAGADVLCDLQPGAHGLHGWLVGCASCVIQGRGASIMDKEASNRPRKRLQRQENALCGGSRATRQGAGQLWYAFFQRPARAGGGAGCCGIGEGFLLDAAQSGCFWLY